MLCLHVMSNQLIAPFDMILSAFPFGMRHAPVLSNALNKNTKRLLTHGFALHLTIYGNCLRFCLTFYVPAHRLLK